MTIIEFKDNLTRYRTSGLGVLFYLDNGTVIPPYFHITEMGTKTKHFVDCGGKQRIDKNITFQLWTAEDFNHRLTVDKILTIIEKFENMWRLEDLELEIEYTTDTIGLYAIKTHPTKEANFILIPKQTNCLAPDKCLVPNPSPPPNPTPQPRQCNSPSCC